MALPKIHRLRDRRDFNAVYRFGLRRSGFCLTLRALKSSPRYRKTLEQSASESIQPLEEAADKTVPSSISHADICCQEVVSSQPTRAGIVVSQKVSKRAVIRNRIKRQISAALHRVIPYLETNWRLVIVVHPAATQCDYEQFLQELKQLLVDAEVFDGH